MSVYEKWKAATKNMDIDGYATLLHDDYTFVRHQTNTTVSRDEWVSMAGGMLDLCSRYDARGFETPAVAGRSRTTPDAAVTTKTPTTPAVAGRGHS